jgi:hypothetical protein
MLYLLNLRKHSNQTELDQFFKTINNQEEPSQHITKSAFFQSRKQLSHSAFIDLNHQLNNDIYNNNPHYKTWKGFRLCAIDGSSIRLPNEADIINYFGTHKGRESQENCAMGMTSVFYDVLNRLVIDASVNPANTSERKCVADHLEHASENDLIVYDRGYNAFWLHALHIKHDHMFCVRAKTNQNLAVKAFLESGKKESTVTFIPNKTSIQTCIEKGLSTAPIELRLIRVDLKNDVEVLITNLMDTDQYNADLFQSLYHSRWGIEENYKRLKQWVEIENFSGKSALSVKQDFHAKIVAMNLTALMAMAAENVVAKKTKHRQLKYQINFAQALSKMKHKIVDLILQSRGNISSMIRQTIDYIGNTIEAVRDGRSNPRRLKNTKNGLHFPAYKNSL